MDWTHLLHRVDNSYYTEFLRVAFCIAVIIIYLIKGVKAGSSVYLAILCLASFLQELVVVCDDLKPRKSIFGSNVSQNSLYPYLIVELACCLLYIKANIKSRKVKKVISLATLLFIFYTIIFCTVHHTSHYFYLQIPTVEGFLIILFCLYYFYEIFTIRPDKKFSREPSFWAVSGMLVVLITLTPYFMLVNYFENNYRPLFRVLYIVNDISYCLLFITFIIAIVCDKRTFKYNNI